MIKNNVIDLKSRRKLKNNRKTGQILAKTTNPKDLEAADVLDMTKRREAILSDEKRKVRRTILTGFVGAFVVIPTRVDGTGGLLKVDIYDISEDGISFDMSVPSGAFTVGDEVAMRVYLSHDTYFPFVVKVQNYRPILDESVYRHGANFIKGTVNDEALFHFVKFIETVSASLEQDSGDIMVSGLKK